MKIDEMFPSRFLKSSDLSGRDLTATINEIAEEMFREDKKFVLVFQECKPLILNKTNARTISLLYGEDTENWLGKKITLFTTEVSFRGETTVGIRVRTQEPPDAAGPGTDLKF